MSGTDCSGIRAKAYHLASIYWSTSPVPLCGCSGFWWWCSIDGGTRYLS